MIDVSHIAKRDYKTRIQRVVKSIVRECYRTTRNGIEVQAIQLNTEGEIEIASDWLKQQQLLIPGEGQEAVDNGSNLGDVLLMLDSSWEDYPRFAETFSKWRRGGGVVVTAVYDLLPIRMPDKFVPGGAEWFQNWLDLAIKESDGFVCISKSVANDLIRYIQERTSTRNKSIQVGYWPLGVDITNVTKRSDMTVSSLPNGIFNNPAFLMVGTLEPRKGHDAALSAFEDLWGRGILVNLIVIGKHGWMCEHVMLRMRQHPHLGRHLFFIEDADESVLQTIYKGSTALLFPTSGEGFGLPLVEAARYGLPVIATDLPVLREIGEGFVTFFPFPSSDMIAMAVEEWLEEFRSGTIPDIRSMPVFTWEESAERLLKIIVDREWYRTV